MTSRKLNSTLQLNPILRNRPRFGAGDEKSRAASFFNAASLLATEKLYISIMQL